MNLFAYTVDWKFLLLMQAMPNKRQKLFIINTNTCDKGHHPHKHGEPSKMAINLQY